MAINKITKDGVSVAKEIELEQNADFRVLFIGKHRQHRKNSAATYSHTAAERKAAAVAEVLENVKCDLGLLSLIKSAVYNCVNVDFFTGSCLFKLHEATEKMRGQSIDIKRAEKDPCVHTRKLFDREFGDIFPVEFICSYFRALGEILFQLVQQISASRKSGLGACINQCNFHSVMPSISSELKKNLISSSFPSKLSRYA